MPLLFAVTMFVSASLLFMVQPMVAKAVLPLLGGSPAVWNGCMVFFQALLLLGYLYADRLTRQKSTSKQWVTHCAVLALPVVVFALAVVFSAKHTPIAVVEALAPSGDTSPVLSVLAILTIAIGIPFFVCSTTATLLQKWFTYTGHPSARDPYFLYAASNFGSLISLLGYPIFIEPNLTQGGQTWVWAVGFLGLAALIVACGKAAVNPLGVPPGSQAATATPAAGTTEPPPSWARMAKWTALAFVPSSLMLGVTFHMTTDIASIPLLWVGPLALYLITFIIAFGRVPPWFRLLIGNLAPVMILLLVFSLTSGVIGNKVGLSLLLHLVTFFAAALMCHYELARDRPSPQYLTTYFLIMSLGGVLGGIFNSLVAPVIFAQDYEYKLVLVIACLMVPRLSTSDQDENEPKPNSDTAVAMDLAVSSAVASPFAVAGRWVMRLVDRDKRVARLLDLLVPVLVGLAFWQMQKLGQFEWYSKTVRSIASTLGIGVEMIHNIFVYALPVMVCFFFVDRPVRFALCVAVILGISTFRDESNDEVRTVYTERSFFGILKVEQRNQYTRLVHGTTLHGTQINENFRPHWADEFQRLTVTNPLDNIVVLGAQVNFNPREEPLTYYHRSGPVGAMFRQLRTRNDGADENAPVAMVGLGTGSASCYVSKGQKLTFYEIDPAVRRIVETPWKVMNEKDLKERGSAPITDPEVRAKVDALGVRIYTPEEFEKAKQEHADNTRVWETYKKNLKERGSAPVTDPEIRKQLENLGASMYALYTKAEYEEALRERGSGPISDPVIRKKVEALGGHIYTQEEAQREAKARGAGKEPLKDHGVIIYNQQEYEEEARNRPDRPPVSEHVKAPAPLPVVPQMGPFTYVADARRRGAEIDFRMGDARLKLKEETDRKYALLLVDAFSSDSIPVHLLTNEAVALYLDRLTDDGILALHISNKFVRLEPVVAAIAKHHNLVARVWNDDAEGRPGKTASSWVALARKPEHLGARIASPIGDLVSEHGSGAQLNRILQREYPELIPLLEKAISKQQETALAFLDKRTDDRARWFAALVRRHGVFATAMSALHDETGYGFRPVEVLDGVEAWTDDYADVMRVMMIPELQALRKFFGLPTPVER
ncbi:MAG TPA: fused MFS/spermidine synthase [Gemmata sp.]